MFSLSRRVLDTLWPASALATPYLHRNRTNQLAHVGGDGEVSLGPR